MTVGSIYSRVPPEHPRRCLRPKPCCGRRTLSTRGYPEESLRSAHVVPQLTGISCQRLRKQFFALCALTRSDIPGTYFGHAGIILGIRNECLLKSSFSFQRLAGVGVDLPCALPVAPLRFGVQDLVNYSLAFGLIS